jgi:hypothetical protein
MSSSFHVVLWIRSVITGVGSLGIVIDSSISYDVACIRSYNFFWFWISRNTIGITTGTISNNWCNNSQFRNNAPWGMVSAATAGVAAVVAGGDVVLVVAFSPPPALLAFPAVEPADDVVSSEVDDVLPPDVLVVLVVVVALLLLPPPALLAFPAVEPVAAVAPLALAAPTVNFDVI